MRELQTCDFCGADPVGVYEPLPASLASDQPRVALCVGCRDTLRRVLAPLDGADAAEPSAAPEPDHEPASLTESDGPTPVGDEPGPDDSTDGVTIDQPTDAGSDDAPAAERPPGYAQVLRLVRNRDEPLPRDALESLASSAYDASAAEVRRAIDAAVENGDLAETDDGVRGA